MAVNWHNALKWQFRKFRAVVTYMHLLQMQGRETLICTKNKFLHLITAMEKRTWNVPHYLKISWFLNNFSWFWRLHWTCWDLSPRLTQSLCLSIILNKDRLKHVLKCFSELGPTCAKDACFVCSGSPSVQVIDSQLLLMHSPLGTNTNAVTQTQIKIKPFILKRSRIFIFFNKRGNLIKFFTLVSGLLSNQTWH